MRQLLQLRLIRYGIFGGLSYLIDISSFLILYNIFHTALFLATSISFTLGLLFSFATNKLFVFEATKQEAHHTTTRQAILYGALVVFNMLFTYIFVKVLLEAHVASAIAKTLSTACITLWNFFIYKRIIFKKKDLRSIL